MVAKISTQPELSLSAVGEGGNIGHVYDKNRSDQWMESSQSNMDAKH